MWDWISGFWVCNEAFDSDTVLGTYASSPRPEGFGVFGWECSEQPSQGSPRSSTALNTKKIQMHQKQESDSTRSALHPILCPYHLFVLAYVSICVAHIVVPPWRLLSSLPCLWLLFEWLIHRCWPVWGPVFFLFFSSSSAACRPLVLPCRDWRSFGWWLIL